LRCCSYKATRPQRGSADVVDAGSDSEPSHASVIQCSNWQKSLQNQTCVGLSPVLSVQYCTDERAPDTAKAQQVIVETPA
jgi:hypothetical protein